MGALGYTKNKLPFLELASMLPFQVLEYMTQGKCHCCLLGQPQAGNHVQIQSSYPAGLKPMVATGSNHSCVVST